VEREKRKVERGSILEPLFSFLWRVMKLLFISNGHGEDAIGGRLAQEFRKLAPNLELAAVPIVGRGMPYERAGIPVLGPRWELPSGGFTFTSFDLLLGDWRDGMYQKTHEQHWAVRNANADAVLVVGDVYALWVTFSFAFKNLSKNTSKPRVFQVQPLVSRSYQDNMTAQDRLERANRVTVDSFTAPDRWYMKRVEKIWARDARTSKWLHELALPQADFAGNVMMDLLEPECDLQPMLDANGSDRPVLALLPGTRDDYRESLPKMLEVVAQLPNNQLEVQAFAAFPGDLNRLELPSGWTWTEPSLLEREASAERTALNGQTRVPILRNAFAALLHASQAALGTAGTANEQAVGLGKPTVAFPTNGPQFTGSFARAQKRLLGDGLILLANETDQIVNGVRKALTSEAREVAKQAGLERMGTAGAANKIVLEILEKLGITAS
jgi:uncharacterized protein (TIGR03492 family)